VALNPLTGAYVDAFDNLGSPNEIGVINGTAAVDYASKLVVFTSWAAGSPNTLWCVRLDESPNPTFTLVWARALGDISSSPVIRGDRVYVGTDAGTLYSIDLASGAALLDRTWGHGNGAVRGFVWPDRTTDDLYFATDDLVHGVSDTAGGIVPNFASFGLGGGVVPSPVLLAPGTQWLYVGGSDGKLYEIDVTGPTAKPVTLGDGMAAVGAPSLDRGHDLIHVGTEAGIFYAVQVPLP
jgi:outer membrane protein assembly factor BamB